MNEVRGEYTENGIRFTLSGRIDSYNASEVEEAIQDMVAGKSSEPVVLDAQELEYISSAGLRVLLHLKKTNPDMKIVNVRSEVYEILEMTGFTQMMTIEKAYRVISLDGCDEIGRGANGTVYRFDEDTVVKVYNNADALAEIQHEREVARLALILGIPTAISYDVVRVGDSYGSVFELLNARSFSKILANEPEKLDWCVKEFVKMLKRIHDTAVPHGELPDMRETAVSWAEFLVGHLPEEMSSKLLKLVKAVPYNDHMLHGDYHTKNLQLQGDEVLLIDMDTLAVGDPIFELGSMYNAFIGFSELDHKHVESFQGFDFETSQEFWHKTLASYLGTDDERKIRSVEEKARIIGYTRLIRRSIRRNGLESERGRAEIALWTGELKELLEKTDTLLFTRDEIEVDAQKDNLPQLISFVNRFLSEYGCPANTWDQIDIAVEEIFVNISSYAYGDATGKAAVRMGFSEDPRRVQITFRDSGIPYDPLEKQDPDVTLSADERPIGGLGIFMVKKMMDEVTYEYRDGQNILRLKKYI